MNPQDDPEQRIRDLERPLNDQASASELGVTQPPVYDYPAAPPPPPPPPPPPYGSAPPPPTYVSPPPPPPYGSDGSYGSYPSYDSYGGAAPPWTPPPSKSGGGVRVGLVIAVFALGALIVGLIVVLVSARVFTSGSSDGPTSTFASRSPFPETSAKTTTRTRTTTSRPAPTTPAIPTPVVPGSADQTVDGIDKNETIDCKNGSLEVNGIDNVVTVTGNCTALTVTGIDNKVTVDSADAITATGSGNQVTYHTGSPKVTNQGLNNRVEQG